MPTNAEVGPAGRNFTAQAEGFDSTWINFYSPFTRQYGDGGNLLDSNGALVPDAARAIPGPHRCCAQVQVLMSCWCHG